MFISLPSGGHYTKVEQTVFVLHGFHTTTVEQTVFNFHTAKKIQVFFRTFWPKMPEAISTGNCCLTSHKLESVSTLGLTASWLASSSIAIRLEDCPWKLLNRSSRN